MSLTSQLRKIEQAGFHLNLSEDGWLHVGPADRLTEGQTIWIREHRQELVDTLWMMQNPHVQEMLEQFEAEIVSITKVLP